MYIIGAGGHGKVVAELAELNGKTIKGFIDDDSSRNTVLSYKVSTVFPAEPVMAVVAIGNNMVRREKALENKLVFCSLIHPKACLSSRTIIGEGTVVVGGATINIDARIGRHVIINTNSSVGHDCEIGDFVHIGPNVALAGNVKVGEGTHIGLGAAVIQGVSIGKWCVIGAGSVVIKDVPDGAMVVGNPARIIKTQIIETV
ncbi:acetyltransferase [Desertivirga xinjiangensis]|uniref:acetyltransferase n=1 Tax=Desertivirga xinjiangensis TaxID=539206 RepID=UPI00210C5F16|nr:acetyltransferase [Pedobacter xinjiangensis]